MDYSHVFQRMIAVRQSHYTDDVALPLLVSSTLWLLLLDDGRLLLVENWSDHANDCYIDCSFDAHYYCPVRPNGTPSHHAAVGYFSSSFYPFASCDSHADLREREIPHVADHCTAAGDIHDYSVPAPQLLLHDIHPCIAASLGMMDRAGEVHNHAVAVGGCLHNPSSEDVACTPAALAAVIPPAAALTAAVAYNSQEGMPPADASFAAGYNTDRVAVPPAQGQEAFREVAAASAAGPWDREPQAAY